MSVNINNYPTLNTYAALAKTGITSATITNGSYGSKPTETYTNILGTVDPLSIL